MSSDTLPSLSGQLLIAMPAIGDPHFERGVALLCQHDDSGAAAVLINRRSEYGFRDVLRHLDLPADHAGLDRVPVLVGGPVQPERGFVLHSADSQWESSYRINAQWAITTSRDILIAMAEGRGPQRALMTLGYAGWSPGQLEQELGDNAWLTVEAVDAILFDTALDERWQAATRLVGIESFQLTPYAGHA
ncbi:MAG TPA: YqgE/AlgH family protein [Rhodanobacteraceae bacterium]|nr:YqgE/AlgH family protein [Rhodanobacteraceae bacterium]